MPIRFFFELSNINITPEILTTISNNPNKIEVATANSEDTPITLKITIAAISLIPQPEKENGNKADIKIKGTANK